jgi:hypothetical protein
VLDVLQTYLNDACTPELRSAVEAAHAVFERINLQNYDDGFEEILMTDDSTDQGESTQHIVDLTNKLLRKILAEHTVVLAYEASMEVLVKAVEGILDLQDYEDRNAIVGITNLDLNPQEKFAELMALVTSMSVEEWLLEVEEVGPTLITRVREMAEPTYDEVPDAEAQQALAMYAERFIKFMNFLSNPKLTIGEMLMSGLPPGYPFEVYVNMLGRGLDEMTPERAAQELLAMAFVSSDGTNSPRQVIHDHLEHLVADVNKITKIDIKLNEYLLGLAR